MKIEARFDNTEMLRRLRHGEKRLAYAAVNALNFVAKKIQKAERERVEKRFTVRRRDFIMREAAKIKPFASVTQARAFVEIAVGEKPRLLLSKFERGATRKPVMPGATFVAEPVLGGPARPEKRSRVPRELFMSRLKFDRTATGKRRIGVTRTGTFLIEGVGIFQRVQGAASRMVYAFTRGKRLDKRLQFVRTGRRVADRWLREAFEREIIKALTRSQGRGS